MEQDHVARGHSFERAYHLTEREAFCGGIVVGVGGNIEAGGFEHGRVVFPGGHAHPDPARQLEPLEKVAADAQRAGPTGGVHGHGAFGGDDFVCLAENDFAYSLAIGGVAGDRQVTFGFFVGEQALFGLLDRCEDGRVVVGVFVDADAEIDLLGSGVVLERFGQAQNCVGRRHLDVLKHVTILSNRIRPDLL